MEHFITHFISQIANGNNLLMRSKKVHCLSLGVITLVINMLFIYYPSLQPSKDEIKSLAGQCSLKQCMYVWQNKHGDISI